MEHDRRRSSSSSSPGVSRSQASVGKRTLTQRHTARPPVQLARDEHTGLDDEDVFTAASRGVAGGGGPLPHLGAIQRSFGEHDVSDVRAHVGGPAAEASETLGAHAYATGNDVAFASQPSLFLAAHEAAHVVQQRSGVHLSSAVGHAGDSYEHNADAVAARVVAGESAADLLGPVRTGGAVGVQRDVAGGGLSGALSAAEPEPSFVPEGDAIDAIAAAHGVEIAFRGLSNEAKLLYQSGVKQAGAQAAHDDNEQDYTAARAAHDKPLEKSTLSKILGAVVDIASFASAASALVSTAKSISAAVSTSRTAGAALGPNTYTPAAGRAQQEAKDALDDKIVDGAMGVAKGVGSVKTISKLGAGGDAHGSDFLANTNAAMLQRSSQALADLSAGIITTQIAGQHTRAEQAALALDTLMRHLSSYTRQGLQLRAEDTAKLGVYLQLALGWSQTWEAQMKLIEAQWAAITGDGSAAIADPEQLPVFEVIARWNKSGGAAGSSKFRGLTVAKDLGKKVVTFDTVPYFHFDSSAGLPQPCHAYRERDTQQERCVLYVADPKAVVELQAAGAVTAPMQPDEGTNERQADGLGTKLAISAAMADALGTLQVPGFYGRATMVFIGGGTMRQYDRDRGTKDFLVHWKYSPEFREFYKLALGEHPRIKDLDGGPPEPVGG